MLGSAHWFCGTSALLLVTSLTHAYAAPVPTKTVGSVTYLVKPRSTTLPDETMVQSGAASTITAWMRPNRQNFDSTVAPFVTLSDATFYELANAGTATTIAAEAVVTLHGTGETGNIIDSVATVGDLMIIQSGAVAEAIGIIKDGGTPGEIFDIIACNTFDPSTGLCILVDYHGTSTHTTYSATISGVSSAIPVQDIANAPSGLSQWAEQVMELKVGQSTN